MKKIEYNGLTILINSFETIGKKTNFVSRPKLYAFHVYKSKSKKYQGTYTTKSLNLQKALDNLKNGRDCQFMIYGGYRVYKSINEL
jgi:dihydrofolate reductase